MRRMQQEYMLEVFDEKNDIFIPFNSNCTGSITWIRNILHNWCITDDMIDGRKYRIIKRKVTDWKICKWDKENNS